MRSILEKAIVHLLNEEHDKAEALIHRFMVDRARQIHEKLRQSDDRVLEEGWDEEITSESYFTEEDLEDLEADEAGDDAAMDDMGGDDMDAEGDAEMADAEVEGDLEDAGDDLEAASDELEGDLEGDDMADGDVEGRIEDLEDQLERLTAEFEALMADDDADMDGDADMDMGDEMVGDEVAGDEMADDAEMADGIEDDMSDEDGDEETFDDITESIVSDLEKISVTLADGKEVGDGKAVAQNKKSVVGGEKAGEAAPVATKAEEHKGFDREPSPAVKDMPKRRNTRSKATDDMSSVAKEGDKGAMLNKDFAK